MSATDAELTKTTAAAAVDEVPPPPAKPIDETAILSLVTNLATSALFSAGAVTPWAVYNGGPTIGLISTGLLWVNQELNGGNQQTSLANVQGSMWPTYAAAASCLFIAAGFSFFALIAAWSKATGIFDFWPHTAAGKNYNMLIGFQACAAAWGLVGAIIGGTTLAYTQFLNLQVGGTIGVGYSCSIAACIISGITLLSLLSRTSWPFFSRFLSWTRRYDEAAEAAAAAKAATSSV